MIRCKQIKVFTANLLRNLQNDRDNLLPEQSKSKRISNIIIHLECITPAQVLNLYR